MFHALSYGERWRVNRLVAKGKSPQDPRLAAAAVELAEKHQRREREVPLHRGLAINACVRPSRPWREIALPHPPKGGP
jgi:hypothetical protein